MAKKSSSKSYRRDDRYSEENTSRRASIATKINKQICGNMCCPKCGKQMVLEKKYYQNSTYLLLVCSDCDVRAKVEERDHKLYLLSTPANKKTREMRAQAHRYMDAIINSNVMDKSTVYKYFNMQLFGYNGNLHIGECDAPTCSMIISEAKKILDFNGIKYE